MRTRIVGARIGGELDTLILGLALVAVLSLVAGGCERAKPTAASRKTTEMGIGWGDEDAGVGSPDAAVPAPAVTFLQEFGHPEMRSASRVAVSPDGDVVVTDPTGGAVFVVAPYGALRQIIRLYMIATPQATNST